MVVLMPDATTEDVAQVLYNIAGMPAFAAVLSTSCIYRDICVTPHGVAHIEKVMEVSIADLLAA